MKQRLLPTGLGKVVLMLGISAMPVFAATGYNSDDSARAGTYSAQGTSTSNNARTVATQSDDRMVDKRIHDKIDAGWVSNGYPGVQARVEQGRVYLTGFVETQKDKDKVEKEIRNVDGVKAVDSKLQVRELSKDNSNSKFSADSYATSADEQLNKKIRDNISKGVLWDSYTDVILNTTHGHVILTGTVNSLSDQQKLVSDVQQIEGVKSVKSELQVKK